MREGNAERGFTLIELMVVVAIVAVLALVAVPQFFGEAKRSKGRAEVDAMFAEFSTKLQQYKTEKNVYLAATKCPSGGPNKSGYNAASSCMGTGTAWTNLGIVPTTPTLYCAYTVVVGTSADTLTVPSPFKTSTGTTGAEGAIATNWYYLLAECDNDGAGASSPNATYYMSSVDMKTQVSNKNY